MLTFTDSPATEIADLSFAEYQSRPGINQSLLKLYDRESGGAPAKYRHACLHPHDRPEPSTAMEFGSAYHARTLTPDEFERRYVIRTPEIEDELYALACSGKSKAKGFSTALSTYKEWVAMQESAGKIVITQKQADQLQAMRAALLECREVQEIGLFDDAAYEISLFAGYNLPDGSKLQLKGRLDILPKGDAIVDLKTARSAHPREFARAVADMSLDIQAAFYGDLCRANKIEKQRFGFLAQDKDAPYLAAIHWMPEQWVQYGRIRYRKILLDIAESIRTNRWPGYESGELMPPSWLLLEIESIAA